MARKVGCLCGRGVHELLLGGRAFLRIFPRLAGHGLDRGRARLVAIAGGNASKVRGVAGLLNGHAVTAPDLTLITDHLEPPPEPMSTS